MHSVPLNLGQIHERELKCLVFMDRICREHGLTYSLAYGTLLGAIRHKGFIPWDDDADVMMPESDYRKLVNLFADGRISDSSFRFFCPHADKNYYYTIGRLGETESRAVSLKGDREIPGLGVFIDIYPYYRAFDDDMLRELVYRKEIVSQWDRDRAAFGLRKIYSLLKISASLLYGANNPNWMPQGSVAWLSENSKQKIVRLLRLIFRITGSRWSYWLHCGLLARLPRSSSVYYDPVSITFFESSLFDNLIELDFEGHKFLATPLWERVLVSIYGDYLVPPPEEMRGSRHHYEFYDQSSSRP